MKKLLLPITFLVVFASQAQIVTEEKKDKSEDQKEQKEKEAPPVKKSGIEIYAGISPSYTFRTLSENEGIFGDPIGERENEVGEWVSSFELGIRNNVTDKMQLQFGVGFSRNRESYSFESTETDSIYSYVNTYRHISFPVRLNYQFGEEIAFFGGIGLMPKAFLSMKKVETVIDINNQENEITTIAREGYNFFVLDAVGSVGTKIKFNSNYGIYATLEARQQLSNNFNDQQPYIRRPYALGFNLGIQIYL